MYVRTSTENVATIAWHLGKVVPTVWLLACSWPGSRSLLVYRTESMGRRRIRLGQLVNPTQTGPASVAIARGHRCLGPAGEAFASVHWRPTAPGTDQCGNYGILARDGSSGACTRASIFHVVGAAISSGRVQPWFWTRQGPVSTSRPLGNHSCKRTPESESSVPSRMQPGFYRFARHTALFAADGNEQVEFSRG